MKTLFIPAITTQELNTKLLETLSKKLPSEIALAYSIQYKKLAESAKKILEKNHKLIHFIQVLGCSQPKFDKKVKSIVLFSDGKFHSFSLARESGLPTYLFNNSKIEQVSTKEISEFEKNKKSALVKYLNASRIGVLISTKPGQENLQKALKLKIDKETYYFLANNLNTFEFENFPQIQSWVNTACRRMDLADKSIINIGDLN